MNTKQRLQATTVIALTFFFISGGCAQESDYSESTQSDLSLADDTATEEAFVGESRVANAPGAGTGNSRSLGGGLNQEQASRGLNTLADRDLGGVAGGALSIPDDRLLEYSITLTYRTEAYREARQSLLQLAAKHGHVVSSYASTDPNWSMNTTMRIRVAEMYTVLKELDQLGALESEQINSTDHTEGMVLAERQYRRERVRLIRRNSAANRTPAANKTWAQREQLIEQSESRQDAAEHEQWKIQDRVSFAQIEVRLLGPDVPVQIEVPPYQNAFIILLNLLLEIFYAMIVGAPLLLFLLFLWIKRGAIKRLLGIKSNDES